MGGGGSRLVGDQESKGRWGKVGSAGRLGGRWDPQECLGVQVASVGGMEGQAGSMGGIR